MQIKNYHRNLIEKKSFITVKHFHWRLCDIRSGQQILLINSVILWGTQRLSTKSWADEEIDTWSQWQKRKQTRYKKTPLLFIFNVTNSFPTSLKSRKERKDSLFYKSLSYSQCVGVVSLNPQNLHVFPLVFEKKSFLIHMWLSSINYNESQSFNVSHGQWLNFVDHFCVNVCPNHWLPGLLVHQ